MSEHVQCGKQLQEGREAEASRVEKGVDWRQKTVKGSLSEVEELMHEDTIMQQQEGVEA